MNLDQRVSVVMEEVDQVATARLLDDSPDCAKYNFLRNQLITLLKIELGAEILTLGKAIGLLEMGNINAAQRTLRARARELR